MPSKKKFTLPESLAETLHQTKTRLMAIREHTEEVELADLRKILNLWQNLSQPLADLFQSKWDEAVEFTFDYDGLLMYDVEGFNDYGPTNGELTEICKQRTFDRINPKYAYPELIQLYVIGHAFSEFMPDDVGDYDHPKYSKLGALRWLKPKTNPAKN